MNNEMTVLQAMKLLGNDFEKFNEEDKKAFKRLANVRYLTKSQEFDWFKKLSKYKNDQLKDYVIVFSQHNKSKEEILKHQEENDLKNINKSWYLTDDGLIKISFDYNEYLKNKARKISFSYFDWNTEEWIIPIGKENFENIKIFLKENYFSTENINELDKIQLTNISNIYFDGKYVKFKFDYNEKLINYIRTIKYSYFDHDKRLWSIKLDEDNYIDIENFCKIAGFQMPEKLINAIKLIKGEKKDFSKKEKELYDLSNSLELSEDYEIKGLKGKLEKFQKPAIKYIIENKDVLLGDDMGLGKTIETIAALHEINKFPILIVCPNNVKYHWLREWKDWSDKDVKIINSNEVNFVKDLKEKNGKINDIYILNYPTMTKFSKELSVIEWQGIVIDESHYVKNRNSKRTNAIKNIVENTEPPYKILLTGTATLNRPNELITQLEILNKLNEFGGYESFVNQFCNSKKSKYEYEIKGRSNIADLYNELRASCYIRRNKKDVMPYLPDKNYDSLNFEIDNKDQYDEAKQNFINFILKNEGDEAAHRANRAQHLVQINKLKQLSSKGKLDEIKSWINNFIKNGEKLVVFGVHREIINELSEYFNCNKIDGNTDIKKREEIIEDFQNNEETKLIILNMKASGVGITLTAARNIAFVELGWNSSEHEQAEDRIHRFGQKYQVNIYYLISKDTIEQNIYNLINNKGIITTAINKGQYESVEQLNIVQQLLNELLSS